MDGIFKFTYTIYMFSKSDLFEDDWKMQVKRLHEMWDEIGQTISRECFAHSFCTHCDELNLPGESYNLKNAFQQANAAWRIELILSVADRIVKHYDDDVPLSIPVVSWDKDKKCVVVDKNISKTFYEM